MKKIIALLMAMAMVFALCACGSSAPAASTEPAAVNAVVSILELQRFLFVGK